MKHRIFTLIVSLLSSFAMGMEEFNDKISQQYLVHLSDILPRSNFKVAGNRPINLDSRTGKMELLDPQPLGSIIRSRITLHHCLGGTVPDACHGFGITNLCGETIKIKSYLYEKNDRLCAFLDHLSSFQGEIIGGVPYDIFTADKHIYGHNAIIILPFSRIEEFRAANPEFEGRIVSYDPLLTNIHNEVNHIIEKEASGLPTYRDFNCNKSYEDYEMISSYFKSCNLYFGEHERSLFRFIEHLLKPFRAYLLDGTLNIRNDEFLAIISLINIVFEEIKLENSHQLSVTCFESLLDWHKDTLWWLRHIYFDPKRKIQEQNLHDLPFQLYRQSSTNSNFQDYISNMSLNRLDSITDKLKSYGFGEYGDCLYGKRLFQDILKSIDEKWKTDSQEKIPYLLKKSLNKYLSNLTRSPLIERFLRFVIDDYYRYENSVGNEKTCYFLNIVLGHYGQRRIWGLGKTWVFQSLLEMHPVYKEFMNGSICGGKFDYPDFFKKVILNRLKKATPNFAHLEHAAFLEAVKIQNELTFGSGQQFIDDGSFQNYYDFLTFLQPEIKSLSELEIAGVFKITLQNCKGIGGFFLGLQNNLNIYLSERTRLLETLSDYDKRLENIKGFLLIKEEPKSEIKEEISDIEKVTEDMNFLLDLINQPELYMLRFNIFNILPELKPTVNFSLISLFEGSFDKLSIKIENLKKPWLLRRYNEPLKRIAEKLDCMKRENPLTHQLA